MIPDDLRADHQLQPRRGDVVTLHERIEAAVRERMAVAQAASPGPWRLDPDFDDVFAVDDERCAEAYALTGRQQRATAAHIAANDPARILRDCERDLKVLERHAPAYEIPLRWVCRSRCKPVPCPELVETAEAYGITEEAA